MERGGVWGSFALGCFGWLCCLLLSRSKATTHPDAAAHRDKKSLPHIVAPAFWWLALGLPLGVWAMSLPTAAPFSEGQGWGRGFLLGGGGALAAAFVVFGGLSGADALSGAAMRVSATASLFAALPVVCVPLLWMRHAVIEALLGIALGWVAVSLVLILGLETSADAAPHEKATTATPESDSTVSHAPHMSTHAAPNRSAATEYKSSDACEVVACEVVACEVVALLLLNGLAFAATLCAACALGVYRDFVVATVARGTYSAVAVGVAASVALALLSSALIGEIVLRLKEWAFDAPGILLVTTLPLALAYGLAMKMLDDIALIYVVGAGLLLGFLLWWLALDADREEGSPDTLATTRQGATTCRETHVPPLAILVALCGFMLGFQLMQGFGVGLMLLAAWPISVLALPSSGRNTAKTSALAMSGDATNSNAAVTASAENANGENAPVRASQKTARSLTLALSLLAILLLSRLFAMRFRLDLRGANFSDQFAMFGFAAGAVVPFMLASRVVQPQLFTGRSTRETLAHSSNSTRALLPQVLLTGVFALALPGAMLGLWGAKVVPAFFAGLALATAGLAPLAPRLHTVIAALCLAIGLAVSQWAHHLAPLAELPRAQRLQGLIWGMGALLVLFLAVELSTRLMMWQRKRVVANNA